MKIGVISDSHGELNMLKEAINHMVDRHHIDALIHLGDDSTDLKIIGNPPIDIYWVPGLYEDRYKNEAIENRQIIEFEGIPFLLTHSPTIDSHDLPGDIDPREAIEDGDVQVVLYGHLHRWRIGEEKEVVVINPGHLTPQGSQTSKGLPPSYALLDVSSRKLEVKIMSLTDEVEAEKTFFFEV